MTEPGRAAPDGDGARRFLTFRLEEMIYALPAEEVSEVIRPPSVARAPGGPRSLLGMANLRGSVLPVASLRGLLGHHEAAVGASSRAIVLDGAAPVALAVDCVDDLVSIPADQLASERAALAAYPGERLLGVFQNAQRDVVKVLDIRALLAETFTRRAHPERETVSAAASAPIARGEIESESESETLMTFEVAGQDYALALEVVREIIPAPDTLPAALHGDSMVLGVAPYRDGLLPILSLRGLLGFGPAKESDSREKVLVISVGGVLTGLLVDRTQAVIVVDPDLIEPPAAILAARMGGEVRIKAIYRGEGGRRLICVLAPETLFRDDVMAELNKARGGAAAAFDDTSPAGGGAQNHALFLVFRLGAEEFGLPIETVDEVARVPDRITGVPRTKKFLEGVINLRGEVLPIFDQRRRFGIPELVDSGRRRLVVVRTDRHRAGLIVDGVSEVLRVDRDAVEQAPDFTSKGVRLVDGAINLADAGRMVRLLDPAELLSHAKRGLLDEFTSATRATDL